MAEGGEYSSAVLGSNEIFEYTCTPCADDGTIVESLKYCSECEENLCAACVKYHQKVSATKKHTLQDNEFQRYEGNSVDSTSDEDKLLKCLYHPDRDIEMYCDAHKMVYCSLCIAKDHRQCSGILELEEAAEKHSVKNKDEILRQIDSLQTDLQAKKQKKEVNLIELDQEKKEILKTIDKTERLIIDRVRDLVADSKAKTCIRYDDLRKDIQDEKSIILQAITDTSELKGRVKAEKELDAKQQFAGYILQKDIILQTEKIIEGVEEDERKMKCFMNDELIQQVTSADCLVQIVANTSGNKTKDKILSKKSQKEVVIKGNRDKKTCSIYGICELLDGTVIVADHSNDKLKRLSKDFIITEELDLNSTPLGMCLTGNSEVAVKLKNQTVLFVSINDKFTKGHSINLEIDSSIGLACLHNELWCSADNVIKVYNKLGKVVKSFCSESFEGTKFKSNEQFLYPVDADSEFVYLTDVNNQVACIDKEGNVWSVINFERLERVRRGCITQSEIIFLAGYTSGNKLMFNKNGKCLGELVDGLVNPDSLCYVSKTRQLIVGHKNKDILTIIETD